MFFSLLCVLLVTIAAGEAYAVSLTPLILAGVWVFLTIYALRLVLRGAWQQWSPRIGAAWMSWSPQLSAIAEVTHATFRQRPVPAPSLVRIAQDVPRSPSTTLSAP